MPGTAVLRIVRPLSKNTAGRRPPYRDARLRVTPPWEVDGNVLYDPRRVLPRTITHDATWWNAHGHRVRWCEPTRPDGVSGSEESLTIRAPVRGRA